MKKWSKKNLTQKKWNATEKIEKRLLPGFGETDFVGKDLIYLSYCNILCIPHIPVVTLSISCVLQIAVIS